MPGVGARHNSLQKNIMNNTSLTLTTKSVFSNLKIFGVKLLYQDIKGQSPNLGGTGKF